MKTIFMALAITVIGAAINTANAQPSPNITAQNNSRQSENSSPGINKPGFSSAAINAKALKYFQKLFPNVQDETWIVCKDGGIIARFAEDSIKTTVAYNKRGLWQYTLRYYNEKNLSKDIWKIVKSSYCDYNIEGAIQVIYQGNNIYIVYIQNEKNQKAIRVCNDDVEEIQTFANN